MATVEKSDFDGTALSAEHIGEAARDAIIETANSVIDDGADPADWVVPVDDTTPLVKDPADPTKLGRIDVGALTTGTTRTITMPDQNVDLTPDTGTFQSPLPVLDTVALVKDPAAPTKRMRIDAGAVTAGQTRVLAMPDTDVDLAALTAENTDCEVGIDILSGLAGGGTWTPSMQATGPQVARTAADAADDYWIKVPDAHRTAALRGIKPLAIVANYTVGTADAEDVRFELYKSTMGADNAARTRTLLGGDQNAHYDAAHDTAAERGDDTAAPELHRITMTVPTPAYVALDEQLWLRVYVDGAATTVFNLTAAKMTYAEQFNDVA